MRQAAGEGSFQAVFSHYNTTGVILQKKTKDKRVNLKTHFQWNSISPRWKPYIKANRYIMIMIQNTVAEGEMHLKLKVFAYIWWGCFCCRVMQMLPMMKPCFPPPHAGFAFIPARSLSSSCNPASGTEQVLTQTSVVWGEEQEQLLTHELCPGSHLRSTGILLCTAFPLKHSSQLHTASDIAKYTVPSPASSLCFFKYSPTPVFSPPF